MKNPADPNGNIYEALGVAPAYSIDDADHMERRAIVLDHRARRAGAQSVLLRNLPAEVAAAVYVTLLELEADAQTERHELDAEWFKTTLKAHQAGQQEGRVNGYNEGITDAQMTGSQAPAITH